MKKTFTILIAAISAILMMALPVKVMGQVAPANTELWKETWTGGITGTPGEKPSQYGFEGTTVYGGATLTYSESNTATGLYNEKLAGGSKPELLLKKSSTWTISGIPTGGATKLTLTYKCNNSYSSVSSTTTGVTVSSGDVKASTITYTIVPNGASSITLVFSCSSSGNTRIDDVLLKVKTAGAATTHTFNYASNNASYGSVSAKDKDDNDVSNGASIAENAQITLTAAPNSGYALLNWSKSGTDATLTKNYTSPTVFQMGTTDASVTATFAAAHNFEFSASNGSVAVKNGDNTNITTNTAVAETATLTVTATPTSGYKFKQWNVTGTGSGVASATTNPTTFTMGTADAELTAVFEPTYHVIYNANTEGASGSTTDANEYVNGQTANVQACGFTKSGFTFQNWNTQSNGEGTTYYPKDSGNTPDQITIGTANVNLYAIWAIEKETVTIGSVSEATISAVYSGGSITSGLSYDCGTVIQLRADGLASGKAIVWDVYKTGDETTKVTVTNNSFTLPAYAVTISGSVGHMFVKYTGDITEGDYVFYSAGAAMKNSVSSNRFVNQTTNISVNGNEMVVTTDATAADVTWHIANISQTSYWTLYNADESSYGGSTATKNTAALLADVTDYAKWTVEEDENTAGAYDFINLGRSNASDTPGNKYLRKNGNSGWASYSSGQAAKPNIYKKATSYQVYVTDAANGVITASTSGQSPIAENIYANIRSGAIVTLTITPDEYYTIQSLTVYKTDTPETTVTVTNNQFTMPDYAVTVEVEFRSTATVILTYSVNGNESSSEVTEGDITLQTDITVPTGYTFAGWSTSPSDFSTLYNGSYSLMGDTKLYAVFSANKPALFSFEITASDFTSDGGYSPNNYEKTTTASSSETDHTINVRWTSYQIMLSSSAMQWQKSAGYLYNSTDLGTIKSVTITSSEGSYTTFYGTTVQPSSGESGSGNGYFKTSVGSATGKTSSVVVTFEKNAPFYFTRVIGTETATGNITINGPTIIENGKSLNMGSHNLTCDDPTKLIIEDGGQLITSSANVQATVKKETYAATAKDAKTDYYWYAISSAVANPNISSATNLITETGAPYHYDLYRYNEAATATNDQGQILYWENYRASHADFTTLEKGRGYLYRNASDLSITMTGEINVADFKYSVTNSGGPLAGFNLIGNPYSHDIYKGDGTAIPNGSGLLRTGFYYMEPTTGKWTIGTDRSTAIKPNQGILVQTDASGDINMTNTNSNGAKYNNDNIMFKVANSQYSDETYAWFDKGRGLNKINHRNAEVPMIYINQDGEDYAIATMSDDTKAFSLNFKAMTMGKYTLSYKTRGEFNYLHVIDRLTGEDVDMLLEGEYSFVASPSDSDARFIVKLAYLPDYGDGEGDIFAYQNGSDIFVSGEGELQIFDVMGRFVMSERINGVKTISADELSKGVYVLRLVGNGMKTQKIVVK